MSQSRKPCENHSSSLRATLSCTAPLRTQVLKGFSKALSLKKKCSDSRHTGVVPLTTEIGFLRSAGVYVEPQFSHESPCWSAVPQTGQIPLTYRSGKNILAVSS